MDRTDYARFNSIFLPDLAPTVCMAIPSCKVAILSTLQLQEYAVGDAFIDEVQVDKLGGFIEKVSDNCSENAIHTK